MGGRILLALLAPVLLRAEEPAGRALALWRAGDRAALGALARAPGADPWAIADALSGLHAAGTEGAREAAAALAEEAGLPALMKLTMGWARLGPEDLARERRLRDALARVEEAAVRGAWREALERAGAAEADLAAAPKGSLAAIRLLEHRARALDETGRMDEALAAGRAGAAAAAAAGWTAKRAEIVYQMADGLLAVSRPREALPRYQEVLALVPDQPAFAARCWCAIASCQETLEDRKSALAAVERARELLRGAGADARALNRLALVLNDLGLLDDARAAADRAARAADAAGDRRTWAEAQVTAGTVASNQGRHGDAARHFDQALGVPAFRPPPETLVKVGKLHADLRQHERALGFYRRALDALPEGADRPLIAAALLDVGTILSDLGRRAEAVAHFERARAMALRLGQRHMAAFVLANLAVVHLKADELEPAREAGETAIAELERHGTRSEVAWVRQGLGSIYSRSGDPDRALRCFEEALREQRAMGSVSDAMDTLINIAILEERLERFARARAAARAALDLQGRVGGGLGLADAAALRGQTRLAAELGFRAAAEEARSAPSREERDALRTDALWFAESARGLLLAEELRNRAAFVRTMLEPALREALDAAAGRRAAARRRLLELDARPGAGGPELERARAAWDDAEREHAAAVARVERESRRAAGVVFPAPVDRAALGRALPKGCALVLWQEARGGLYAIVADGERLDVVALGRAAPVKELAATWLEFASAGGPGEEETARRLYDALFRPLEERLEGAARLLIAPDGPLAFLSVEALVRGKERLIERHEVAYVPSATVLESLAADAAGGGRGSGLLALADPAAEGSAGAVAAARERGFGGLGRLPEAAAEARAIAALYPEGASTVLEGEDATLGGLRSALERAPGRLHAVHFACHGLVHARSPGLSGLLLAGSEIAGADELVRLRVPADLAVLSACESARGRVVRGEGVIGLVRSLFFAGCPRVVVSNWKVGDRSTRALMTAFYEGMLRRELAPAAALRAAKLERLRDPATAPPAHWAAFVLWGFPD